MIYSPYQEIWLDTFWGIWKLTEGTGIDSSVLPYLDSPVRVLYQVLRILRLSDGIPIDSDLFLTYMATRKDLNVISSIALQSGVNIRLLRGMLIYRV